MLSWIEIDGKRLCANIDAFKNLLTPITTLMVVVKANAYGHGLQAVTPLIAERADWLGVNSLEEALEVTSLGIQKPIVILGHTSLDRIEDVVDNGYRQVLYRLDVAEALSKSAEKLAKTSKVHLKIETGTNRQGVAPSELEEFVGALRKLRRLEIEGVYTHFANIEDTLDAACAILPDTTSCISKFRWINTWKRPNPTNQASGQLIIRNHEASRSCRLSP